MKYLTIIFIIGVVPSQAGNHCCWDRAVLMGLVPILVLAELGGASVVASGLRLRWWQPLCVPELSLVSAEHHWGSPCRAGGAQTHLGDPLPCCLVPIVTSRVGLALFGTQGFARGTFGEPGGGLWLGFSHSFVSLPVLWLRHGAGGSSHGGCCCRLRGHWGAVPHPSPVLLHFPAPRGKRISPAPSFSWKQRAFPGGSACLPHHAASPTGTHPAASLSPSSCPALYPTHSQGFSAMNLSTAGLRIK